jgi:hypothetical protein
MGNSTQGAQYVGGHCIKGAQHTGANSSWGGYNPQGAQYTEVYSIERKSTIHRQLQAFKYRDEGQLVPGLKYLNSTGPACTNVVWNTG